MATLSVALDTQTNLITVSEALTLDSLPEPITVDSENMAVTGGSGLVYSVTRGANGTARASHSLGATVTVGWVATPTAASVLGTDVAAALSAADSPSGSNPFTTGFRTATISLSSAQLLALFTTPVVVVAEVSGKAILPFAFAMVYHYGTVAYAHVGEGFNIGWPDTLGQTMSASSGAWFDGTTADGVALSNGNSGSGGGVQGALVAGDSLKVYATANPTNGNGTMTVSVAYLLIDTAA